MIRLEAELVVTDLQWEVLRQIRNSCRQGFTHNQEEVSIEQQREYRNQVDNRLVRHYLYRYHGVAIGFSRLEWRDGFIYPTYGVALWARGNGFAWDVVKLALLAAGGPLKGDLLDTNDAIKKVDYTLGFLNDGPPVRGIQKVTCSWPPPFIREAL